MSVTLSRLPWVLPLHPQIPECVLRELAESCGTHYDDHNWKEMVESYQAPSIHEPSIASTTEDLRHLSFFINPYGRFSKRSVLEAYTFVSMYMDTNEQPPIPDGDFLIGNPNHTQSESVNLCILYHICRYYRLPCQRETTSDTMKQMIQSLLIPKQIVVQQLLSFVKQQKETFSRGDLLHVCMTLGIPLHALEPPTHSTSSSSMSSSSMSSSSLLPRSPKSKGIEKSVLNRRYKDLFEDNELYRLVHVETPEDAIVMAASQYNINISFSQCPIEEWERLVKDNGAPGWVDPMLQTFFKYNPLIYSLRHYFFPDLPLDFYKSSALEHMTSLYDMKKKDKLKMYNELLSEVCNDHFWKGWLPPTDQECCLVTGDSFDAVDVDEFISFGNMGTKVFKVFTFSELTNTFQAYMSFRNPCQPQSFTRTQIKRLKAIAKKCDKKQLLFICDQIDKLDDDVKNAWERIRDYYMGNKQRTQEVTSILVQVFHMGLSMRGWNGDEKNLPIDSALHPADLHSDIEVRTTHFLVEFERLCSQCPVGNQIKQLPLVLWDMAQRRFLVNTVPEKGLSIHERMHLLRDETNQESCIRLSSNYILSSANMYLGLMGVETFPIEDMRFIS